MGSNGPQSNYSEVMEDLLEYQDEFHVLNAPGLLDYAVSHLCNEGSGDDELKHDQKLAPTIALFSIAKSLSSIDESLRAISDKLS